MASNDRLTEWLEARGLSACAQALLDNSVDLDLLPELSEEDLASIGLVLGLRRRLMRAVAEWRPTHAAGDAAVAPPPASPSSSAPAPTAIVGERRHLAVLVCDLVNSTGIASSLDAEDWHELVAAYQAEVAGAVSRFGGHIAKHLGDGAMVYFGYPQAQENDAERAVRAGLAIQAAMATVNARFVAQGMPPLATRVGLHAGIVVVGEQADLSGDVPSLAARAQGAGEPGDVVITADVNRLVPGLFVVEERGTLTQRGSAEPMALFRVQRASSSGRRQVTGRDLTSLVGRGEELRQLANRWARTVAGDGQLVVIVGEPGLGKTRLVDEFQATLADHAHTWIEYRCAQLLNNTPFHPLSGWAWHRFGGPDQPAAERLDRLEVALRAVGLDLGDTVPMIAALIDLPLPERYAQPSGAPEERRTRLLETAVAWLMAGARQRPLVLVVEDAQWADPSTLELMRALTTRNATSRLLMIVTSRPEFQTPWPMLSHHTQMMLAPLNRIDAARVITEILATHGMPAEMIEAVVVRTGGVPLFLEEVTRLLLDSSGRVGAQAIPPTLAASLTARLDRLGEAKEVAQIGAVLGREFSWRLIQAIAGITDVVLEAGLERLAEADLVIAQGHPPNSVYRFKHALIQDAARDALLRPRRRDLHRAAAGALSAQFKDLVQQHPELLAHHLTEAGDLGAAVTAWQNAGMQAVERGAFVEGAAHFQRAIEVLIGRPDPSHYAAQEFQLRTRRAECVMASRGHGAPETVQAYEEALAVGERVGDYHALSMVLSGLVSATVQQAQFETAGVYCNRLVAIADRTGGTFERGWADYRLGSMRFYQGDLTSACALLENARRCCQGGERLAIGGLDLANAINIFLPWTLILMGQIDTALELQEKHQLTVSAASGAYNRVYAALGAIATYRALSDAALNERYSQIMLKLSAEHKLPLMTAFGKLFLGSALSASGRHDEAVAAMEEALALYERIGQRISLNGYRAMFAEALAAAGEIDRALTIVEDAASLAHLAPVYAPLALRMKGDVLRLKATTLTGPARDEFARASEPAYRESIEIGHRMGAVLYELEAATGLALLLRDRGEPVRALEVLAPIHARVTQGAGSTPVRAATDLIGQLRQ